MLRHAGERRGELLQLIEQGQRPQMRILDQKGPDMGLEPCERIGGPGPDARGM
jgi:hypothetical protein